jgi:hypothetical protein
MWHLDISYSTSHFSHIKNAMWHIGGGKKFNHPSYNEHAILVAMLARYLVISVRMDMLHIHHIRHIIRTLVI